MWRNSKFITSQKSDSEIVKSGSSRCRDVSLWWNWKWQWSAVFLTCVLAYLLHVLKIQNIHRQIRIRVSKIQVISILFVLFDEVAHCSIVRSPPSEFVQPFPHNNIRSTDSGHDFLLSMMGYQFRVCQLGRLSVSTAWTHPGYLACMDRL